MQGQLAELWSHIQRLLARFPITTGSVTPGSNSTVLNTSAAGAVNWGKILAAMLDSTIFGTTADIADVADTEAAGSTGRVADAGHVHDLGQIITVNHLTSGFYTATTYTPNIYGATTPGTNTYSNRDGGYVRIGGVCIAWFQVIMTAKDVAMDGDVYVTLPLTMSSAAFVGIGALGDYGSVNLTAGYTQLAGVIAPGSDRLTLREMGDNVAAQNINDAAIANNTFVRGFAAYPV